MSVIDVARKQIALKQAAGKPLSWSERSIVAEDARAALAFAHLGVRVTDTREVTTMSRTRRALGPLVGAQALVTDGARVSRVAGAAVAGALVGPAGLLVGLTSKSRAVAFVVFKDGSLHEQRVSGNSAVIRAQADAVRFNALAAAAASEETG
jgi:hypothetical protein